jgi:transposase InsO family protein
LLLACRARENRLLHHSDRGTQYLSIRHTERLAQAGIEPSVGSRGDSYDNALAESVIGLFKTEVIRRRGPWRSREDVEFASLEWVWWFNHYRLLGTDRVRSASRVRGSVLPSRGRSDRSGGTQVK